MKRALTSQRQNGCLPSTQVRTKGHRAAQYLSWRCHGLPAGPDEQDSLKLSIAAAVRAKHFQYAVPELTDEQTVDRTLGEQACVVPDRDSQLPLACSDFLL